MARQFNSTLNLNWTEAQKKVLKNYRPGQVLTFHTAANGMAKNEALEVVSANERTVLARNAGGGTIGISSRDAKNFAVLEKQEIEVSAGDKLLLQANWRDKHFRATNGELVTVARVDEGRIQLVDGRELPAKYRQFTHGYAVTAHQEPGENSGLRDHLGRADDTGPVLCFRYTRSRRIDRRHERQPGAAGVHLYIR